MNNPIKGLKTLKSTATVNIVRRAGFIYTIACLKIPCHCPLIKICRYYQRPLEGGGGGGGLRGQAR